MVVAADFTLENFKAIFRDHYEEFLVQYPEYERTREVVKKMLSCGDKGNGYFEMICPGCGEKKVIAFS